MNSGAQESPLVENESCERIFKPRKRIFETQLKKQRAP